MNKDGENEIGEVGGEEDVDESDEFEADDERRSKKAGLNIPLGTNAGP